MVFTFGSAEDVAQVYHYDLRTFALLGVLAFLLAIYRGTRDGHGAWRDGIGIGLGAGLLVFLGGFGISRYLHASQFIAADVSAERVILSFGTDTGRDIRIARNELDSVLYGLPGKYNRACYLRFTMKSGDTYRSMAVPSRSNVCARYREEILHLIQR